jgi:hypothetical protein
LIPAAATNRANAAGDRVSGPGIVSAALCRANGAAAKIPRAIAIPANSEPVGDDTARRPGADHHVIGARFVHSRHLAAGYGGPAKRGMRSSSAPILDNRATAAATIAG